MMAIENVLVHARESRMMRSGVMTAQRASNRSRTHAMMSDKAAAPVGAKAEKSDAIVGERGTGRKDEHISCRYSSESDTLSESMLIYVVAVPCSPRRLKGRSAPTDDLMLCLSTYLSHLPSRSRIQPERLRKDGRNERRPRDRTQLEDLLPVVESRQSDRDVHCSKSEDEFPALISGDRRIRNEARETLDEPDLSCEYKRGYRVSSASLDQR